MLDLLHMYLLLCGKCAASLCVIDIFISKMIDAA